MAIIKPVHSVVYQQQQNQNTNLIGILNDNANIANMSMNTMNTIIPSVKTIQQIIKNHDYDIFEAKNDLKNIMPWCNYISEMPKGWTSLFGAELLHDISIQIVNENKESDYEITEIKEKYGSLRVYMSNYDDTMNNIIDSYSCLSSRTCTQCGQMLNICITMNYILPICESCLRFENMQSKQKTEQHIKKIDNPSTIKQIFNMQSYGLHDNIKEYNLIDELKKTKTYKMLALPALLERITKKTGIPLE